MGRAGIGPAFSEYVCMLYSLLREYTTVKYGAKNRLNLLLRWYLGIQKFYIGEERAGE